MDNKADIIKMIYENNIGVLSGTVSSNCLELIKNKISEIPSDFFEQRICTDENTRISLVEFSMLTSNESYEKVKGLLDRYHINHYDYQKLQSIIDSINVVKDYGTIERSNEVSKKDGDMQKVSGYGIALANKDKLDKAYPLWVAYLCANAENPYLAIKEKLISDGMDKKYEPEYIMGLISHTNSLMEGKGESEMKDFYLSSISSILDDSKEKIYDKSVYER